MIKSTVPGKLGKDAETKSVGQTTVTEFSVATDERVKVGNAWEKQTTWVRCALWGKRGEAVAQYLTKGSSVVAFGKLRVREYTQNGEKRFSVELECDDVTLMGGGNRNERPADDRASSNSDRDDFGTSDDGFPDVPF